MSTPWHFVIHQRDAQHRSRWFTYKGEVYYLLNGGPGWGYEIIRERDDALAEDSIFSLAEAREFIHKAAEADWDSLVPAENEPGEEQAALADSAFARWMQAQITRVWQEEHDAR